MNNIKRLPLSRTDFAYIRDCNMVYVDKTDMIASIARANSNVGFFLGRPRRFGKTLLVNTFEDLFTNGLKNFKGLKIDTQNLWTDTKTYPVLHLDFSSFKEVNSINEFSQKFYDDLQYFAITHNVSIVNETNDPVTLAKNIFRFFQKSSLVLLIDEYDAALNAVMLNSGLFEEIRNIYSNFLSAIKTYEGKFRFIFITGITRYTNASIFSPFNILYDLSLDPDYQTLLGYTNEELTTYFGEYLEEAAKALNLRVEELHQRLKEYYDGYYFTPDLTTNLYCPFSILNFLNKPKRGFQNYWNESGAGTDVVNRYFKLHPISCKQVLSGVRISKSQYNQGSDITQINYAILLQQAGYYSFSKGSEMDDFVFSVPNQEVANIIYPLVFENETGVTSDNRTEIERVIKRIVTNLFAGDDEEANREFNNIFDYFGYDSIKSLLVSEAVLRDNLFCVFKIALNSLNLNYRDRVYSVAREEINRKRRADLILELNQKERVVIELKLAESENEAQEQIETRDYGNNGFVNPCNIKSYATVFYKKNRDEKASDFGVLLQQLL